MPSRKMSIGVTVVLAMFATATLTTGTRAAAQTEKVLYNFNYSENGKDGAAPNDGLIFDAAGNLYGTTVQGGTGSCVGYFNGCGTVFELMLKAGGGWVEKVLHSFSSNGKDGQESWASLIFNAVGNLYGTTAYGGPGSCANNGANGVYTGCGTVFELTPKSEGWAEKILHSFGDGALDGQTPVGSLIFDAAGNLYGTTANGGAHGYGTVFELKPMADGGCWTERILHSFGDSASDGISPQANLIFDASGNLYGTTQSGGAHGGGTVFELMPHSEGWTEKILHSFGNGSDGTQPYAGLIFDASGNLYSTTAYGGAHGNGTVFELTPKSGGWAETILYSLDSSATGPLVGLIFDTAGNLYGTTDDGGSTNGGTAFKVTPAEGGVWTGTILHNFMGGTTDGCYVHGGLIFDDSGNLYGTTALCGADYAEHIGDGVVFEITP